MGRWAINESMGEYTSYQSKLFDIAFNFKFTNIVNLIRSNYVSYCRTF